MKRLTAMVAVLGLFVLGVVAGALGAHLYYARHLGAPGGPHGGQFFAHRLEGELDLTTEQTRRIEAILEESRREADALRHRLLPEVHAAMEHNRERIMEVLTEDQRERFERLRHRRSRWAEHFFLDPPPGHLPHRREHRP